MTNIDAKDATCGYHMGQKLRIARSPWTLPPLQQIIMKIPTTTLGCITFLLLTFDLFMLARSAQFPFNPPTGYGASQSTLKNTHHVSYNDAFEHTKEFASVTDEHLATLTHLTEGNSTLELGALSDQYFTRIDHPMFPHHSVRIKRSKGWCDTSVGSYTGYIDIGAKHLFFYFFESRSPSSDLILWTNGGPGCSSSLGLFMELGPCQILSEEDISNPRFNPHSWNNNASVIFIDQPIGVGFSYADYGEHVGRTEEAAIDVAALVAIFMDHFFNGREGSEDLKFHLAGESYGGRYLPVFASEIVDLNTQLRAGGFTPIPIKSVMIGNGITDFASMSTSYYDVMCTNASFKPQLPIATCVRMRRAIPRCEALLQSECLDRFDTMACQAATASCGMELMDPFFSTGLNPYDISKPCDGPIAETLCYPITQYIRSYLNKPDIRKQLGVSKDVGDYTGCTRSVGVDFNTHADRMRMTAPYVEGLLERGVKVLIYVGTYDWICNHIGNYRWTSALKWSGHKAFHSEELREWKVGGELAGYTRTASGLTFATILGAGHMVPYDKPEHALTMVNRWLSGQDL